jgi:hypothetical protein
MINKENFEEWLQTQGLSTYNEAFEKFLKMCWISDLKREVKRKVKVNWFHEANV